MSKANTVSGAFFSSFEPEPNSGCWLWTGPDNGKGYGRICAMRETGKQSIYAHHASWLLHRGEIPPGKVIRHKCDVTCCVNPDHLEIGTQGENVQDRQKRMRQAWGVRHADARLTPEAIAHIRRKEMKQAAYAALYGVCDSHISRIQAGRKWRHL